MQSGSGESQEPPPNPLPKESDVVPEDRQESAVDPPRLAALGASSATEDVEPGTDAPTPPEPRTRAENSQRSGRDVEPGDPPPPVLAESQEWQGEREPPPNPLPNGPVLPEDRQDSAGDPPRLAALGASSAMADVEPGTDVSTPPEPRARAENSQRSGRDVEPGDTPPPESQERQGEREPPPNPLPNGPVLPEDRQDSAGDPPRLAASGASSAMMDVEPGTDASTPPEPGARAENSQRSGRDVEPGDPPPPEAAVVNMAPPGPEIEGNADNDLRRFVAYIVSSLIERLRNCEFFIKHFWLYMYIYMHLYVTRVQQPIEDHGVEVLVSDEGAIDLHPQPFHPEEDHGVEEPVNGEGFINLHPLHQEDDQAPDDVLPDPTTTDDFIAGDFPGDLRNPVLAEEIPSVSRIQMLNLCRGLGSQAQPRHGRMAFLASRVLSLQWWPHPGQVFPLAVAGFFAELSNAQQLTCYHCGGMLANWLARDDPWTRHAEVFPRCAHLQRGRISRGRRFSH